jgi:tRNA(Ile)-lysidine synthase
MLADLARLDILALERDDRVELAGLRRLGAARAKNVLRHFGERKGIEPPSAAQLDELWRQLNRAGAGATVGVDLPGWQFRGFREWVYLERSRKQVPSDYCVVWNGEYALPLLALGGVLRFKPEEGRGVSAARLHQARVTVRLRRGGERLQPECKRPRRTLKNLFLERGIPHWRRDWLPYLYCGDTLVSVPGIGDDCAWQAENGEAGLIVTWERLD